MYNDVFDSLDDISIEELEDIYGIYGKIGEDIINSILAEGEN